ncbi:hypothetical protein MBRA_05056 [Methylobacterium brachiatum]|jgi:hypothetical protein|nr:hypothetical protein MBRA_05056 [Methylobacterium brachiatum]
MPTMRREKFIESYVQELIQGRAGVFIGAGLSMKAGYPSWKSLVTEMAEELELDIDREHDLAGLVQFYLNRSGKVRTRLTAVISDNFSERKPIPEVFRTLARLPVRAIWTTNYDELIERAWAEQRLHVDVKTENHQLAVDNPAAHAVLYKMHGTITDPTKVVIARADYETYRHQRGDFINLLHSHLVSRSLLFLGLSFTDPNLHYLFTLIREAFPDNPRLHFAVVRRPQRDGYAKGKEGNRLYEYDLRRHTLWVDDLQNYGIQCVEVANWDEIDDLMQAVERRISFGSVLVSGSFPDALDPALAAERAKVEAVSRAVGAYLARDGRRLVSGFGLVVGSAALTGALDELYKETAPNLERRLFLRPFPQSVPKGADLEEHYRRYREDLVRQAGICVIVSGVTLTDGKLEPARGVRAEYEMMRALNRIPVPVGNTGGAAAEVWALVEADYETVFGPMPRKLFAALNDPALDATETVKAVETVLVWLAKNAM